MQNCFNGDARDQKKVYDLFLPYCVRVCSTYIMNKHELTEVVNDGFLKVFLQLHRFNSSSPDIVFRFQGWMKRIMINTAIDHLRKHKHYLSASFVAPEKVNLLCHENVIDRISCKEIIDAIRRVSPICGTVFKLYFLKGCSHCEIARLLDITESTSKSNLLRAKKQLKKILVRDGEIVASDLKTLETRRSGFVGG